MVGKTNVSINIGYCSAPSVASTQGGPVYDITNYTDSWDGDDPYDTKEVDTPPISWSERNKYIDDGLKQDAYALGICWDSGTDTLVHPTGEGEAALPHSYTTNTPTSFKYTFKYTNNSSDHLSPGALKSDSEVRGFISSSELERTETTNTGSVEYSVYGLKSSYAIEGNSKTFDVVARDKFDTVGYNALNIHREEVVATHTSQGTRTWAYVVAFNNEITTTYTESWVTDVYRMQACGIKMEKTNNYVSKTEYMTFGGHRSAMVEILYTNIDPESITGDNYQVIPSLTVNGKQFVHISMPDASSGGGD